MSKTLFLHIGHPKTGSSYLQSVLAASSASLSEQGIHYPLDASGERAAKGEITSGNTRLVAGLLENPFSLADHQSDMHVFSGENLFGDLQLPAFRAQFFELFNSNAYDNVRVLLFIRDPVSHAASAYQQDLKRAKGVAPIIESRMANTRLPSQVNNVLDFLGSFAKVATTVRNFSHVRATLVDELCQWLSIDKATLILPAQATVNRSMTASELMLLSALSVGESNVHSLLSNALCNRLPDVLSDDVRPPLAVQTAVWDRLAAEIERVNARVEPAHRYDRTRDIQAPKTVGDTAEFSLAQIQVIAGCLGDLADQVAALKTRNQQVTANLVTFRERNVKLQGQVQDVTARLQKMRVKGAVDGSPD